MKTDFFLLKNNWISYLRTFKFSTSIINLKSNRQLFHLKSHLQQAQPGN